MMHPGLDWLASSEDGRAWLERLPRLVDECADLWSLEVGEPFAYTYTSLTLKVRLRDGQPAVLKLQFPHREAEHEAAALALWDGDGAIRLLAHEPQRHVLLLERCEPGTPLSDLPAEDALQILEGLLPRLWKPARESFRPLAKEAAWWAGYLPTRWEQHGRPYERELLDAALEAIEELSNSQGDQVLVNQDLHADNVLRAEREPWLVIDPKPLAGEREFGIAAIVRGHELGRGRAFVEHRLDRLTESLGLDRDRARRWTLAQTLAWAADEEVIPEQVECARWLMQIQ